jgi:hypothetical protein
MNKDVGKALLFALAVMSGVGLAWAFYAALQPSVAVIVRPIEQREKHLADSLAAQQARADLAARQRPASVPGAQPSLRVADSTGRRPTASPGTEPGATPAASGRRTQLPSAAPVAGLGLGRWGLALEVVAALALAAWLLAEARQRLQPPLPRARVLEALLVLALHQEMLKKSLSPRQIKRFNSKARVQHRQLTALAKVNHKLEFPVEGQLLAFQVLLLLEEDREGPQQLVSAPLSQFTSQLAHACATRADLAAARQQALQAADIAAALAREGSVPVVLTSAGRYQLLAQLYELNIGLLA